MADLLVSEGYSDAGYEFVNVDDCWLEKTRGPRGELVPDRKRFPQGMKSLGQYVSTNTYYSNILILTVSIPFRYFLLIKTSLLLSTKCCPKLGKIFFRL